MSSRNTTTLLSAVFGLLAVLCTAAPAAAQDGHGPAGPLAEDGVRVVTAQKVRFSGQFRREAGPWFHRVEPYRLRLYVAPEAVESFLARDDAMDSDLLEHLTWNGDKRFDMIKVDNAPRDKVLEAIRESFETVGLPVNMPDDEQGRRLYHDANTYLLTYKRFYEEDQLVVRHEVVEGKTVVYWFLDQADARRDMLDKAEVVMTLSEEFGERFLSIFLAADSALDGAREQLSSRLRAMVDGDERDRLDRVLEAQTQR